MPITMDSGPLIAMVFPEDGSHARAGALLEGISEGRYGQALVPDVVLVEALNFIRAKVRRKEVSTALVELVVGSVEARRPAFQIVFTTEAVLEGARAVHFDHYDRALSMTDAVVVQQAQARGTAVATLDGRWGGLVQLLDW